MQLLLVILILMIAVGYAAWRIYRSMTAPPDLCAGCNGCKLKEKCDRKNTYSYL